MRKAASIVDGAFVLDEPAADHAVDERVDVDQPEPERDREHQLEHLPDRRVAPVDHHLQPPSRPRSHGIGSSTWTIVPTRIDARVDVELVVGAVDLRDAEDEAGDDHEVPGDGRQRGDRELVVAVQDPDDDPGDAEQRDDREEHLREPDQRAGGNPGRAAASPTARSG